MAEKEVIVTDGGGSGLGMMLGIVLGILIILGALYFSGAFNQMFGRDTKIDVDISTPAAPAPK